MCRWEPGKELDVGGLEWAEPKGCQPPAKEPGMPFRVAFCSTPGRRCQGEVVREGSLPPDRIEGLTVQRDQKPD